MFALFEKFVNALTLWPKFPSPATPDSNDRETFFPAHPVRLGVAPPEGSAIAA